MIEGGRETTRKKERREITPRGGARVLHCRYAAPFRQHMFFLDRKQEVVF